MKDRIVTLIDNCVYGHVLQAEHGLCVYIEHKGYKYLFDTGSTDLFLRNAKVLHVDIADIDYLILSHGHGDHTGGVYTFLRNNSKAKVVAKKGILSPKFKGERENGMRHVNQLDLDRFIFVDEVTELGPELYVFPDLKIINDEDTHFSHFEVLKEGIRVPDTFEDEQAVVIKNGSDITVLSACSHRGITNIVTAIRNYFPETHLKRVVGGYHIHLAGHEKCDIIADFFRQYPDCKVGVCHCSGVDQFAKLYAALGERVYYNHVGLETEI